MTFNIVNFLERQYGKMPSPRANKLRALYDLARDCQNGAIVELGTYHGLGTIALCLGVRDGMGDGIQVYTVDNYIHRYGWAGEEYRPSDKAFFDKRMRDLGLHPTLIMKSARDAEIGWTEPVCLLFWDTGTFGNMMGDILAWEKHVMDGGKIYIHDTYDRLLGSIAVIERLSGNYKVIRNDSDVLLLEKNNV